MSKLQTRPLTCTHPALAIEMDFHHFSDVVQTMGVFRVSCKVCGQPFVFHGLSKKLDLNGAAVSPDMRELRIAMAPAGVEPTAVDMSRVNQNIIPGSFAQH